MKMWCRDPESSISDDKGERQTFWESGTGSRWSVCALFGCLRVGPHDFLKLT